MRFGMIICNGAAVRKNGVAPLAIAGQTIAERVPRMPGDALEAVDAAGLTIVRPAS